MAPVLAIACLVAGASLLAVAMVIYRPTPRTRDFGELPLYYLARLNAS
jgi:hypothetical protein